MDFKSLMPFARSGAMLQTGETDPFTALRREMDRMFDEFSRGFGTPSAEVENGFLAPRMDVAETEKGLEITAELPGVDPKDISLDVTDGVMTLRAERKSETERKDEKKRYHLVERREGSFLRRFSLPFEPDQDKMEAQFDKGVLRVTVPRSAKAEAQKKTIPIKPAA
jgi:HSP20 family protein